MEAIRFDDRAGSGRADSRVVLRNTLQKQLRRTVFSLDGVAHHLRVVSVRPGADRRVASVVITVSTDNTRECAQVHVARERLDSPAFVASLLAYAMRAVLTGDLPPDGVEAF